MVGRSHALGVNFVSPPVHQRLLEILLKIISISESSLDPELCSSDGEVTNDFPHRGPQSASDRNKLDLSMAPY